MVLEPLYPPREQISDSASKCVVAQHRKMWRDTSGQARIFKKLVRQMHSDTNAEGQSAMAEQACSRGIKPSIGG